MTRTRAAGGMTGLIIIAVLIFAFGPTERKISGYPDAQPRSEPIAQAGDSVRLTGPGTEDDFPALAKGPDGTVWLAYVEYSPAGSIIMEQVEDRRFDSLVPKGNGDRVRLVRFDGRAWQPAIDVTEKHLDVWRPTVSVDGKGNVVVAWSQNVDGDWEIFYRTFALGRQDDQQGEWSDVVRVTNTTGSDFHVVATTDASGTVWLAWQGWRKDNFDIHVATIGDNGATLQALDETNTSANEWTPSLAADSRGNVYVAWDTYEKGNYDVRLRVMGKDPRTVAVADSPRFEARPHIVCDAGDRLWIAYELGDQQWGKDYVGDLFAKVGFERNPAFGLYINRTVAVKCLADGKLMQPTGKLETAFTGELERKKSLPRLAADTNGGIWLLLRHHPLSEGRGETWHSYWLRYDGKGWSKPREVPNSSNLLDNRPALAALETGVLVVHSSDSRTRTQDRDQDDLFASKLEPEGPQSQPELSAVEPDAESELRPVHTDEVAAIARMRDFRLEAGGKPYRLLRGEFHRHTEYTSHRDQDGSLEDSWRYALDAGRLDWMGNGDHDNGQGQEYLWWQIQKISDLFHNPPQFVAAMTYERSVVYPSGHRNVMFPRRGIRPLPRISQKEDLLFGTPEEGAPDVKLLYDYLKNFDAICSSHTSGTGMGTDWRDHDPEVEPVVEIYQGHRHNYEHFGAPRSATEETHIGGYQPAGFVWNALEKGHRLGFQSSSDHVSTHMSYACVLVEEPSRQGIIDAFKRRHCYAATDNIVLVVRSGDHLMGEEFETPASPTLHIAATGATAIAKVHVIRNNKYVFTAEPKKQTIDLRFTDDEAQPGQSYYYYVRVEQEDGNLAWASPMWISYKP